MLDIRRQSLAIVFGLAVVCGLESPASSQSVGMVQFYAMGKIQKGIELAEFAHEMVIMGRDGWIHSIDPREVILPTGPDR